MEAQRNFDWKRFPHVLKRIEDKVHVFSQANTDIADFAVELGAKAGLRLIDLIDHLCINSKDDMALDLEDMGYVRDEGVQGTPVWYHPQANLPKIAVCDGASDKVGLAVKTDSVSRFLSVHGLDREISGSVKSRLRRSEISESGGTAFWVVERRTSKNTGVDSIIEDSEFLSKYFAVLEAWRTRPRGMKDQTAQFDALLSLAKDQARVLGSDLAAHTFFEAEREYYTSKNRAAQIQKNHQDSLGIGWTNHDHHTLRSSRRHFSRLIEFFQILGFELREKFQAGKEAGWGAQVVENPDIGIALFLDVDLSPEEIEIDFLSDGLKETGDPGTVGLWCALHGDSLLESGLHHIAVLSDFEKLTQTLAVEGVRMMKPFSNFDHLKQAFTFGARWDVSDDRVNRLKSDKIISGKEAEKFKTEGAVGSHVENIQRSDGYKGFSQKQVSSIIRDTDPKQYGSFG